MNPRDHHHTPLAATTGVPAYSASSDQPQLMHPTTPVMQGKHHVVGLPTTGATLRRSGSSSSSSSEDDGAGGRRRKKKSITEKIKEKMPGGHKNDDYYDVSAAGVEHQEKKGIMEKIKEKLPGSHNK